MIDAVFQLFSFNPRLLTIELSVSICVNPCLKKTVSILSKKNSAFSVAKKSAFLFIFLLTLFENTLKYPYVSQQANVNRQ